MIKELNPIPAKYFTKLTNTDDIWEVRVSSGNNIFRLLGFWHNEIFIILTNGFQKKTQKTPIQEIQLAEKRKKEYIKKEGTNG